MMKLNILLAIALAALFGVFAIYTERKDKLEDHAAMMLANEGIITDKIKVIRFLENDVYSVKYDKKCVVLIKWNSVGSKILNDTCGE